MNIEYSIHALGRMRTRRISEEEIIYSIQNYDTNYPDVLGNTIYIGHPNNRYIKVVVAEGSYNPILIITAAD